MISLLLKIIGLFCKRFLSKKSYSAKETYNFKETTIYSRPIVNPAFKIGPYMLWANMCIVLHRKFFLLFSFFITFVTDTHRNTLGATSCRGHVCDITRPCVTSLYAYVRCYSHVPQLYNAKNYFRRDKNVFGEHIVSKNILCLVDGLHPEVQPEMHLQPL